MGADPKRGVRWLVWVAAALVFLIAAAAIAFWVATRNPDIDPFYDPPEDLGAPPGTILRSEPFDDGIPTGARAWKVLYVSTDADDEPIAVSGLVIAPIDAPAGPRPLLAWAHGTTGIARACAPSFSDDPLAGIPDMTGPLERGWVLTLTDYPGLGTPSPHPYLVGESQGRAVLDSVRAAHQLDIGLELDDRYAIWGHSQGGHAALFAGQLADEYLPQQELVGVVALAPATRLQDNLAAIEGTEAGSVLTIFTVESWTDIYPDIPDGTLNGDARRAVDLIGDVCLNQPSRFRVVVAGLVLPDEILAVDPTTDPIWTERLTQNTPDPAGVSAPLLVAQGLVDEIIDPGVTVGWVSDRCDAGAPTDWQEYPDVNHLAVVGPGGTDGLSWTLDRFAGEPSSGSCPPTD
jgi:acetyl esterase/lipase